MLESHEDFGEAFTPELRKQDAAVRAQALGLPTPTFQQGSDVLIAGLTAPMAGTRVRGSRSSGSGSPRTWAKCRARLGDDAYGVCLASDRDSRFEYLAGVAVSSPDRLSDGFTTIKVDARRYAVFAHAGHVLSLRVTIDTIWTKWAPDCGLHIARGVPCLQRYTHEFDPGKGLGGMEVWIPLGA